MPARPSRRATAGSPTSPRRDWARGRSATSLICWRRAIPRRAIRSAATWPKWSGIHRSSTRRTAPRSRPISSRCRRWRGRRRRRKRRNRDEGSTCSRRAMRCFFVESRHQRALLARCVLLAGLEISQGLRDVGATRCRGPWCRFPRDEPRRRRMARFDKPARRAHNDISRACHHDRNAAAEIPPR